nr:hypothetical protein [Pseudodesulfovibrio sp.]
MARQSMNVLNADQRMRILKMAMNLEQNNGVDAVLSAYDRILDRLGQGIFVPPIIESGVGELVEQFIESRLEAKEGTKVQASHFYEWFCDWYQDNGLPEADRPSQRGVGGYMRANREVKDSNVVFYLGIATKEG